MVVDYGSSTYDCDGLVATTNTIQYVMLPSPRTFEATAPQSSEATRRWLNEEDANNKRIFCALSRVRKRIIATVATFKYTDTFDLQ